jgi:hypothetical protein
MKGFMSEPTILVVNDELSISVRLRHNSSPAAPPFACHCER